MATQDQERERFNRRLKLATPEQKRRIKHYRNAMMSGNADINQNDEGEIVVGVKNVYHHQPDSYARLNAKLDSMHISG